MDRSPTLELYLPADSTAPSRARALVSTEVGDSIGSAGDLVALLTSELVSNAVRHTESHDVIVTVEVGDPVRVEVVDEGPGFELPIPKIADTPGGWGLVLVDRLADSWGTRAGYGHHGVWFELGGNAPRA
jgi:anti-sigma regulatory factor (Ser/Thr protein kinase)